MKSSVSSMDESSSNEEVSVEASMARTLRSRGDRPALPERCAPLPPPVPPLELRKRCRALLPAGRAVSEVTAVLLVGALRLPEAGGATACLLPNGVKDGLAMHSFSAATMRLRMNLCCVAGTWRS